MRKKVNLSEIQKRSDKIHNNSFIIDINQPYNNMKDYIDIYCKKCGNTFKQKVGNHIFGKSGCPFCYGNKKININQVIDKSVQLFGDKYRIDYQDIENNRSKIKIFCNKCNKFFTQSINSHLNGNGCPDCAGNILLTLDKIREKSNKIHNNLYEIPEQNFKNTNSKIKILCKKCNKFFTQRIADHLKGSGCQKCGITKRNNSLTLKFKDFSDRSSEIHDNKYLYFEDTYTNTKNKTKIFCNKCGRFFNQAPMHHMNNHGCPYCLESKGEKIIYNFLIKNDIKFDPQKKFDDCIYKRKLPFDFYLPDFNLCIEFDGIQHYELFYKRKNDVKSLEEQLIRDKIKTEFCIKNNIKLLRIKYDDDIIEKINFLKNNKRKYENINI